MSSSYDFHVLFPIVCTTKGAPADKSDIDLPKHDRIDSSWNLINFMCIVSIPRPYIVSFAISDGFFSCFESGNRKTGRKSLLEKNAHFIIPFKRVGLI
jgi:hypothetical protein